MEDKKQFFALLKPLRRQLLIKKILIEWQYWFATASAYSLFILVAARFFVIPFYRQIILAGGALLFIAMIIRIWSRRPSWKKTAKVFNEFIPDDRVITAYSFLDEEGVLKQLQLAEALPLMKKFQHQALSSKKNILLPKWLMAASLLACSAFLLNYFPNQTMHLAGEKEKEMAVLKKTDKRLAEQMKKEEIPLAKKELEKAKSMMEEKKTPKEALAALSKQMKELELKALKEQEKQDVLKLWQEELKNSGLNELSQALGNQDANQIMKEFKRLNKMYDSLSDSQKKALGKFNGSENQLSDKKLAELEKKLKEALQAENTQKELASAQTAIAKLAANLQTEMAANGIHPNQVMINPTARNPQQQVNNGDGNNNHFANGSNGNKGTGANSNNGKGTGNANGSGNENGAGKGNGNGSGAGNGDVNGNGSGTGTGSVNGNSAGTGAGFGMGSRYFLTVPEKLSGKTNHVTDSGSIGKGNPAEQFDSNGPVLKGQLRPYQEVYSQYLDSYRNSTDRVKLPSDLEEIVKNYFTTLDPNKE